MALDNGTRLGPYEIVDALGAGGMGEVYRARDTRLGRDVAIKILPSDVQADPAVRSRFQREAEALAALSHPHICPVFDVGDHNGTDFLVMEYLDGHTLAERLTRGALPLEQALTIAIEIADALSQAHRAGVVHRDLKPGNVMLTKSGARLLDFGLAKLRPAAAGAAFSASVVPTQAASLTGHGTILGTLNYMAPEQLEGKEADQRTDIFAFGAVVYEMATGTRAFEGNSAASVIGAILEREPPSISSLQPLTPPALDRAVRKCLAKDPDARWDTAHDLLDELKWITEGATRTVSTGNHAGERSRRRERVALRALVGVLLASTLLLAGAYFRNAPVDAGPSIHASILWPAGMSVENINPYGRFALSPDGRRLAFVADGQEGGRQLWVRRLDARDAEPLSGTQGAQSPFWSADGRFLAFIARNQLKKINASGGPVSTVVEAMGGVAAPGTWSRDDVILFTPAVGLGVHQVPASGGTPSPVTTLDPARGETVHWYPSFLPDGRHFLYFAARGSQPGGIYVASLDDTEARLLVEGGSNAKYADGHLIFLRDGTLVSQAFDVARLTLGGDPVQLAEHIQTGGNTGKTGAFSVSETGVLAYQTGGPPPASQLQWFDRAGTQLGILGESAVYNALELSPDGGRASVSILDPARETTDMWVIDIANGHRTRFTFDPANENGSVWSPDGRQILFNSYRQNPGDFYVKPANSAGSEEVLLQSRVQKNPDSWSSDGRFVLYHITPGDLWVLPMTGDRKPVPFLQTPFFERAGRFSPDMRWVAYSSNEINGRYEVFVAPFQGRQGKWQVSTGGGQWPRWRGDGKEIFFVSPDRKLMSAEVAGEGDSFEVGRVRPLFQTRARTDRFTGGEEPYRYDVTADGQRILVNTLIEQATSTPVTLVVNWAEVLKRAPAK